MQKLIKENLTKMESGGQKGELSCTSHLLPVLNAAERDVLCISNRRCHYYLPAGGKKIFPSAGNSSVSEGLTTQQMKSHYTSNSLFPPMDFLYIMSPSQLPLLLYKRVPLSFALPAYHLWFATVACSELPFFATPK